MPVGSRATIRRCATAGTVNIHASRTAITTAVTTSASPATSTSSLSSTPSTRSTSWSPMSRNSSELSRKSADCQKANVRSRAPASASSCEREPITTPAVTTASTPETWIFSAGT